MTIDNLILPPDRILVLIDEGSDNTGVVYAKSSQGCRLFVIPQEQGSPEDPKPPIQEYDHVLFIKELTAEVEINEVEYLAMPTSAVVGLIPEE